MNAKQLTKLGVPDWCLRTTTTAVQQAVGSGARSSKEIKAFVASVLQSPEEYTSDPHFGPMAQDLIDDRETGDVSGQKVDYRTWGSDIEEASHQQMRDACRLPAAVGAALMPDAHLGYGLPIGGVLALENAVVPYAVGVDIACRMKLSVLDIEPATMTKQPERYDQALLGGTRFGVGCTWNKPRDHEVLDEDWTITRVTRQQRDKAVHQLGTSGSGNHFVEWGLLTLEQRDEELGLDAGEYVALLSHSGSRGPGAAVCDFYSREARRSLPRKYQQFDRLAWLDLDSEAGQEYWEAMNLMGRFAAANHEVIHREVTQRLGASVITGVENHHNFAWKETHGGKEVIVHRKGATPAGKGVLGVIPGSMASPGFVVRGKGNAESLASASHGAGRCMSRKKAKETFRFRAVQQTLAKRGIRVLAAGADEVPGVYKDIAKVMDAQQDLVDVIARFDPKIVRMCGDGSRAED